MNGELVLFTASNQNIEAALQQRGNCNCWESLAFFSKKLSKDETKYSAFDRDLLAIYLAIKHFRHMLEVKTFVIYTGHKPLTFAFKQKPEKSSPQQFRHLDFISQFTTDIPHVSGDENVVADALFRIEELQPFIDYSMLVTSQETDEELKKYKQNESGLRLEKIDVLETGVTIFCDISVRIRRPFLTFSTCCIQ